ncbi:MAG: DUF3137 domain-containing protein [Bacteroidales bacterium]|nr:DUF3137 domain-containing protein [Bacteroidales bacterium]MCF8455017.1 DUF3137 domain-containing protein [Bacteroidales bacterium]
MKNGSGDFDVLFNKILYDKLIALEEKRKSGIRESIRYFFISVPFAAILIYLMVKNPEPILVFLSAFPTFAFLGYSAITIRQTRIMLTPKFKKEILLPMLQYLFDDVEYLPRQRMSKALMQRSLLMSKTVDSTGGDDFVRCRIGQTSIMFSETEAYHGSKAEMIFSGIIITAGFNKSFMTKTVVLPEKSTTRWRKFKLNFSGQMKNAEIVKLEDPVFEKEFMVIGESQVESRYILSPSLMQRMLDYKNKVNRQTSFSFVENRLYVAIPILTNMFEPRIFEPLSDKEFIRINYDYFRLFTDIVEDLDLNTRIWQ